MIICFLKMAHGGIYEMKGQQTNRVTIRELDVEASCKSLGPLGMICLLQQYEKGAGDYTKGRDVLSSKENLVTFSLYNK
jgi:hypothetical protein